MWTSWKNLVIAGLSLVVAIMIAMWLFGWLSTPSATTTTTEVASANAPASPPAQTVVDKAKAAVGNVADKVSAAVAPPPGSGNQAVTSPPGNGPGNGSAIVGQQAGPAAQMGQLPQQPEGEEEVYNPELVPIVPKPLPSPGSLPTAKKAWEVSRDMLFNQVTDHQAPRETRVRAAKALGKFPTAGTSRVLETVMLNDDDPAVRFAAAQSLGFTGSGKNCAGLARSTQLDPDAQVQRAAGKSLGMINARGGNPPSNALVFQRNRDNRPTPDQPAGARQEGPIFAPPPDPVPSEQGVQQESEGQPAS